MHGTRTMGAGAVLLAAVAACTGDDAAAGFDAGAGDGWRQDATSYEASAPGEGGGEAGGDATSGGGDATMAGDASNDAGGDAGQGAADGAADGGDAGGGTADAAADGGDASGGGDDGPSGATDGSSAGGDASSAGGDGSADGGDAASSGDGASTGAGDGASAGDGGATANADAGDGGVAATDAGAEAGIVAPTCDGVIGAGEYGGAGNQGTSGGSSGQTWYMTWDDTNLYIAIHGANVGEGSVLYVSTGSSGLTSGQPYDSTDVTTLPFAAALVVYAHDGYVEVRVPGGTSWGSASTTSAQVCTTGPSSADREEVIPWSLLGARPVSFGWLGYVAASPGGNPNGYIYGQMPADNPGGGPAGNETYAHYYGVADSTPGVASPFANEH